MQTRIKFCGMTNLQDVERAIDLGVDALGFVFVSESYRYLSLDQAQKIIENVPPFVIKVGLFMNSESTFIQNIIQRIRLDLLQFHGNEDEKFCNQFQIPYLKAVPMASVSSVADYYEEFPSATGFVLDSHATGQMGGSGKTFEWADIPNIQTRPTILAGGLTPENVAEAIRVVRPYAVDVSSGIEASKGIKDPAKMEHFIKEVKSV